MGWLAIAARRVGPPANLGGRPEYPGANRSNRATKTGDLAGDTRSKRAAAYFGGVKVASIRSRAIALIPRHAENAREWLRCLVDVLSYVRDPRVQHRALARTSPFTLVEPTHEPASMADS